MSVSVQNEKLRIQACQFLENMGLEVNKKFEQKKSKNFSLYLGWRSDVLWLRQLLCVGGGLQFREQLCKHGKKLVSFTDTKMKRVCSLHPSLPPPWLGAFLPGSQVRGTKAASRKAGRKAATAGIFCTPANKIKGLSSSYFFQPSFFLHFHPFFLFI